jgi:large subunit ribosomal protein L10
MAVTKGQKEEQVAEILEKVKKSQVVYITNYQGLTMKQLNTLRGRLRESNAVYHVVKNTLAERALKDAGFAAPDELFTGPVALGYAYGDIAASARTFLDFGREADKFQLKGAILGAQVLSAKEVESQLSTMRSLSDYRAQLLGLVMAPASRLAGVVAGGVRQVVNVVKAYSDKEKETEEAPAAPAAA